MSEKVKQDKKNNEKREKKSFFQEVR